MSITPDLVEWLLADQKVCQAWRGLACRMSLSSYIASLEAQGGEDSSCLRLLLRLWSSTKPSSYNVRGLKRVLAAEGLHHMWLWISLMTQKDLPTTPNTTTQSEETINSFTLPNRKHTTPSPWSSNLYTLPSSKTSDYSSSTSDDLSSPPPSPDYSSSSSNYTYSCPSTPLSSRRKIETKSNSKTNTKQYMNTTNNENIYMNTNTHKDKNTYINKEKPKPTDKPLTSNTHMNKNIHMNPNPHMNTNPNMNTNTHMNKNTLWNTNTDYEYMNTDKDMNINRFSNPNIHNPRSRVRRAHSHNSNTERLPSLAKLTSPKIVTETKTETWKKEVYKKVIEEVEEYNHNRKQNGLNKHRSGSLPNLSENSYTSRMDIQLGANTLKVGEKRRKQSEHEKEILQLCDDIIAEMKVKKTQPDIPDEVVDEPIYDKISPIYEKINKVPKKDTSNERGGTNVTETTDKYITVKEVKIVTVTNETDITSIPAQYQNTHIKPFNKEASKEYFENLVTILEEAVRDLER